MGMGKAFWRFWLRVLLYVVTATAVTIVCAALSLSVPRAVLVAFGVAYVLGNITAEWGR